jgi:hypothetical protein
VKVVITIEVDEDLVDEKHPTGLTMRGFAYISDALRSCGSEIFINGERASACTHPSDYVDGEYLRCSSCGIIVGRA